MEQTSSPGLEPHRDANPPGGAGPTAAKPAGASNKRKRVRLSPEARRQQILDAALIEFSSAGFEGTTMDRVAQRVGLSKAGLYAHFSGKEAVFEALLRENLFDFSHVMHWHNARRLADAGASMETSVDRYLDASYSLLAEPRLQATFRLLIAESGRASGQTRGWQTEVLAPFVADRQEEMQRCIADGSLPDHPLTRSAALNASPMMMALLTMLLLGKAADEAVARIKGEHRQLLLGLLSA